jgi:hypothetical protein
MNYGVLHNKLVIIVIRFSHNTQVILVKFALTSHNIVAIEMNYGVLVLHNTLVIEILHYIRYLLVITVSLLLHYITYYKRNRGHSKNTS